jgi:hypothetical protein
MDDVEKQLLEIEENLHKWFKEKWVRFGPDGKIRGQCAREKSSEGKPKCRPLKSAQAMGKKGRAKAARRKRREDPNPDRSGKAKNVKTESDRMDELKCWKGYTRVQGVPAGATGSCKKKTEESITESSNLSIEQLATISDEALDQAYGYGRSTPGNTFGWQANIMSATYAKEVIDMGITDIEKIANAIHKGWNVTAKKFVENPDQFDDTEKLRQSGKLDSKVQQRKKLMNIDYNQLNDAEKEKDRVVASALLQALTQTITEESTMDNITENHMCPICGGELVSELLMNEKKDACYYKVKSRYKVWPSAYASGALVKCRKKGAKNWGTKSEQIEQLEEQLYKDYNKKDIDNILDGIQYLLDVIGLEQTVGAFADGSNAAISLFRAALADEKDETKKHLLNAAISSVSVIPFGDIAKIIKLRVLKKPAVKMFQFVKKYLQAQTPDRSDFSLNEKWSEKYKRSIDCSHPKGFSQKAHCQGRKKNEETLMKEERLKNIIREMIEEMYNEQDQMQDECLECYEAAMEEGTNEAYEECYRKTNWEMVPEGEEHTCEGDEFYEIYGDINADAKGNLEEAEYRGRKVKLGKPMRGDVKKFKVFVRNPTTGKVKKVNFGDKKMRIKKSNPKRRKSFRARHNCANPGPRTKARYWSCRKW